MIVSVAKPIEEIIEAIGTEQRIFLVGCSLCATVCRTGGWPEVEAMQKTLEAHGKTVTGKEVIEATCNGFQVYRALQKHKESLKDSDSLLVLTCGGGVQNVQTVLAEMDLARLWVHPACDTIMQAEVTRETVFEQHCSLCGSCQLELTGGICPTTRCAKHLLNGPCGGAQDGKCEVDAERDCAWALIYARLKALGRLDDLLKYVPMRDHSAGGPPRRVEFIRKRRKNRDKTPQSPSSKPRRA